MVHMKASEARSDFASVLRFVKKGERVVVRKHDKGVAAVVSIEDLAILEAIEDRRDLLAARQAIADAEENGTVSWEEAKTQLGL